MNVARALVGGWLALAAPALLTVLPPAPAMAGLFIVDQALKADRDVVRNVQRDLNFIGFDAGVPDGAYGRRTEQALQAFHTRYPFDGPAGLTQAAIDHIALIIKSLHGNPFHGDLVKPKSRALHLETQVETDVRADNAGCDACNVTPWIVAVGDLDMDGIDDIVVAGHAQDARWNVIDRPTRITIASPGVAAPPRHLPAIAPTDLPARVHERDGVVADFNGDGRNDLFIAAQGLDRKPFPGEQNVLLLSDGDRLVDASDTHLPRLDDMAHGATAGDIDGDGDADILVITNQGQTNVIPYLLENDGTGTFAKRDIGTILDAALVDFRPRNRTHRAEFSTARLADVNGDGALDLLLLGRGEDARRAERFKGTRRSLLLLNDGAGHFPSETMVELPTDRWGYATFTNDAEVADLDGDGRMDIVLTQSTRQPGNGSWYGQFIQILMNEGGRYVDRTAERMFPQGYSGMKDFAFADKSTLADIDGDGDLDLVTKSLDPSWKNRPDDSAIQIALNDGTGHFAPVDPRWVSLSDYGGRGIVAGDFDGDGVADLASYKLAGKHDANNDLTWGMKLSVHVPW